MRIVHISDIHIRSLSRHDEYQLVFDELNDQIQKTHADHVFIGGDIFHSKTTNISPEYIDFISNWFTSLASITKIHIILGNHDGNVINLTRQDAISPIVKALNNPNIFLYKKSGVYEFAPGFNWCVFSLFDEENWDTVKPVLGKVNIACYHGPVLGAKTETVWEVSEGIGLEFFENYDYGFLGDIHRLQFLDYRDVELEIDEKDLSKYPNAEIIEVIE